MQGKRLNSGQSLQPYLRQLLNNFYIVFYYIIFITYSRALQQASFVLGGKFGTHLAFKPLNIML